MKILAVFEYRTEETDTHEGTVNYSLTAVDSHRVAYAGNMTVSKFEITRYADIFYVDEREDLQKFEKSGLDKDAFIPALDHTKPGTHFSPMVVRELLDWANATRVWVYKSMRMTGPERNRFDEFYKKLEWQYNE